MEREQQDLDENQRTQSPLKKIRFHFFQKADRGREGPETRQDQKIPLRLRLAYKRDQCNRKNPRAHNPQSQIHKRNLKINLFRIYPKTRLPAKINITFLKARACARLKIPQKPENQKPAPVREVKTASGGPKSIQGAAPEKRG
jgi:hypothetical protein